MLTYRPLRFREACARGVAGCNAACYDGPCQFFEGSDSCYNADEDAAIVLKHRQGLGMVSSLPEHRGPHARQLTREGSASLNISTWLCDPVRLLKARADVEDSELQCIEVHSKLAEAGWVCQVGSAGSNAKPYKAGEAKVFWLNEKSKGFCLLYLLCLLKAMEGSLQKEAPHFKQVLFYSCLLTGREHV